MLATSYHSNDHVTFYRMFYTAANKESSRLMRQLAGFRRYLNMNVTTCWSDLTYNDLTLDLASFETLCSKILINILKNGNFTFVIV